MAVLKGFRNPLVWVFLGSFVVSTILFAIRLRRDSEYPHFFGPERPFALAFETRGNIGVLPIDGVITESLPILEQLKEYADNPRIKAILVRIDSPGGAVGPSQEIFDELKRLRDRKTIVASFGSVAASGGYYIACAAHKIVSSPGTITGSIGVIMQLSYLEELFKWLKVQPFVIKGGKYKDVGTPTRKMQPQEQALLQNMIDNTHRQFQKAVAWGRGLPLEYVQTFADGRVMNGEIAQSYGLVDQLGNFQDAVDLASSMADIHDPKLEYPAEHRWESLRGILGSTLGIGKKIAQKLQVLPMDSHPLFLWDKGS